MGGILMPSEAQKKALKNYRAKVKRFTVDFSPSDAELYEHIQKQPNKQGYVKALIRADMGKLQGRWAFVGDACVCSICNNASIQDYYFCPECGAAMERQK
jgi:hypothetical protein